MTVNFTRSIEGGLVSSFYYLCVENGRIFNLEDCSLPADENSRPKTCSVEVELCQKHACGKIKREFIHPLPGRYCELRRSSRK